MLFKPLYPRDMAESGAFFFDTSFPSKSSVMSYGNGPKPSIRSGSLVSDAAASLAMKRTRARTASVVSWSLRWRVASETTSEIGNDDDSLTTTLMRHSSNTSPRRVPVPALAPPFEPSPVGPATFAALFPRPACSLAIPCTPPPPPPPLNLRRAPPLRLPTPFVSTLP